MDPWPPEIVLPDRSGSPDAAPAAGAALGGASRHSEPGLRPVVLACAAEAAATSDDAILPAVVNTLAVLTFPDQLRPDARETLDYFREEGVELKVIAGDEPRKVAATGPGRSIAAAGANSRDDRSRRQ